MFQLGGGGATNVAAKIGPLGVAEALLFVTCLPYALPTFQNRRFSFLKLLALF